MLALARIEMLVQRGAIKAAERPRVFWKVRRHPIHDHADAVAMQVVDEVTQVVRLTVTRGRRIVITDLITPRWSIRMFLERQKLDVREAHLLQVSRERLGHLAIVEWPVPFLDLAPPRTEVDFVDRKRLPPVVASGARLQPLRIAKLVVRVVNDR